MASSRPSPRSHPPAVTHRLPPTCACLCPKTVAETDSGLLATLILKDTATTGHGGLTQTSVLPSGRVCPARGYPRVSAPACAHAHAGPGRAALTLRVLSGSAPSVARTLGKLWLPPITEQGWPEAAGTSLECAGGGADARDARTRCKCARGRASVNGDPQCAGIACTRVPERQGARVQGQDWKARPLQGQQAGLSDGEEEGRGEGRDGPAEQREHPPSH